MNFTVEIIDRAVIFILTDKIIGSDETLLLINKLQEYIEIGEKNIIMDFSGVPWMNSQGVDSIVSTVTASAIANCKIVFSGFTDQVTEVLIITRINEIITSYPSLNHALRQLAYA